MHRARGRIPTTNIHIQTQYHRQNETGARSYLHLSRYSPRLFQRTAQPANIACVSKKTVSKQDYSEAEILMPVAMPITIPIPLPNPVSVRVSVPVPILVLIAAQ